MSILQDNLSENPCYGVASDGTGYLEFSCVYGVEKYYGRYNLDVLFVHPRAVCERLVRAVLFFLTLTTRSLTLSLRSFEKYYDVVPVFHWMQKHPVVPVAACLAYGALISLGQQYFRSNERWNWRKTMAAWNLFLSVFSFVGLFRTAPQLAHNLWTYSARDNLCLNPMATYGSGSSGFWVQMFILSKFP